MGTGAVTQHHRKGGLQKVFTFRLLCILFLLSDLVFATKHNVGPSETYTTIQSALSAAQNGDTVWIVGNGSYDEDVPQSYSRTNIIIMGAQADPDSFPTVRLSGSQFNLWLDNANNASRRFIRLRINNMLFKESATRAGRKLVVDQCFVTGASGSTPIMQLADNPDVNSLEVINTIFLNNSAPIFKRPANMNTSGPWAKIMNSTFHGNSTVYTGNSIGDNDVTNGKFIDITNSIFKSNTTICSDVRVKRQWDYNLVPATEPTGDWGSNCVFNDNPGFANDSLVRASHFNLTSSSPAKDVATSSGAPNVDIAGNSRSGLYDIGAWEYYPLFYHLTWDPDAAAGIQSGGGTWGTDNFWTENDGATRIAWPAENSSAIFSGPGGSTYTINLNGTQNVDSLAFRTSKYTVSGGTELNLGANSGVYVGSGIEAQIESNVNGTSGLTLHGDGNLKLYASANPYSGPTVIKGGELEVYHIANGGSGSNIGSSSSAASNLVMDGGTLKYADGSGSTVSSDRLFSIGTNSGSLINAGTTVLNLTNTGNMGFVGTGTRTLTLGGTNTGDNTIAALIGDDPSANATSLVKSGAGTWVVSGTNTFTGGVTVNDGILKVANSSALGNSGNSIIVNNGAAIDINSINLQGYTQSIVINGQIDANTGALINTGSEQQSAIRQIELGSDASIGNNNGSNGRFDIGRGFTGNRIFGNNHTLTKVGSNSVAILADATGLAGLVVNGGEICLEADNAAGSALITVNSDGTLSYWGNRTIANDVNVNGGTIASPQWGTYTINYNGSFSVSGSSTVHNKRPDDHIAINGAISGTGSILKRGGGTLSLNGANSFSGGLTIDSGNVSLGNSAALGGGTAVLSGDRARILLGNGVNVANTLIYTVSNPGVGLGALHGPSGDGETATWSGTLDIDVATSSGGHIHGGNTTGGLIISGPINAPAGVAVTHRSGNVTFSGGGSYSSLHLGEHTIRLGAHDGISTSAVVRLAYMGNYSVLDFDLNGYNQTLAGIERVNANDATITNTSGTLSTLTLDVSDSYSYPGSIEGNLSLVKQGAGVQTLGGANTYTGATTISGGTLNITGSLSSSSAVTVQAGGTLAGTGTAAGPVTVSSSGIIAPGNSGAGTLSTGALTLQSGSVLNFELGTSRDSIKVNGDLDLNATLNVTALDGFGVGTYTLMTYSGTYLGSGITLGTLPAGYDYSLSYDGGSVILTVSDDPNLVAFNPSDNSTDVPLNTSLTVTFDRDVIKGSGNVTIRRTSDNMIFEQFAVTDSRVAVDSVIHDFETGSENFTSGTAATWTTQNSFTGTGAIYALLDNGSYPWTGKGVSSQDWSSYDSLVIWAYTPSSGISASVYIMDGTWSFTTQTPNVGLTQNTWTRVAFDLQGAAVNLTDVRQYGLQVMTSNTPIVVDRISLKRNSGSPVVTISPSSRFSPNTGYYVQIDNGTFQTSGGGVFQGISSTTDWSFTTGSEHFFWDNNTSAGYQVSGGTWGTDHYWSPNGTNLFPWPGSGHSAAFAGADGSYTISINGIQGVDSIAFLNSGYTLSGGTLKLGGESSINAAADVTINSVIDGGEMNKYGSGRLILNGNNTFSGPTTVNGGILQIGNGASGSVAGDIVNDASLVFHRTGSLSYGGIISGTGSVTKSNTGTVTMSGANTYLGTTSISEGTLVLNGSLSSSSAVTVNTGAVLAGTGTASGAVTVESGATVAPGDNGAGTLFTGALELNSTSALDIQLGTSSDQIAVSGNLVLDGTVNVSDISGFSPGNYTIITYTGSLTNNTLEIGSSPSGYDVSVSTATSGSVILVVTTELARYTWDVSTDGGFQASDGTWGTDAFWTLSSGTGNTLLAWPGEGNRAVFGPDADDPGGEGYTDEHTDNNLSGWNIVGARTCWSEIDNEYCTPGSCGNRGFLINSHDCTNDGTFTVTINALAQYSTRHGGIVFRFQDTANYYFLALFEQDSTKQDIQNELRIFKNTVDWNDPPLKSFTNLDFTGLNRHYPIKIVLEGSIFSVYLNNNLLGTCTDATHATGKVGYAYDNHSGPYIQFDRSSWVDGPSPGSAGPFSISVNGTQSVDSVLFTASGYTLSGGTVNLTGVTPAISTAHKASIGSVITGSNGMRKIGTDTLVLSGACTYTGGTIISEGILQLGTGGTSGSVTGTITNNGVLIVNRSDQMVMDAVSGTGLVIKKSGGTLVFDGNNTYSGGTKLEGGTVQIGQGSTAGVLSGNITNSAALVFNRSDSYTYAGVISGTGTVSQNGAGTLVLSGDNTYTGNTTVSSGNLQIDGSLGSTAVTVAAGATLSGAGTVGGSVTVNADGTLAPGSNGAGKLSMGALSLNGTSVLDIELGTQSDTVAVSGNLVLDGVLNITNLTGFNEGTFTIITYSGILTDNALTIGSAPLGYDYKLTASGGEVKVSIVSSSELLPITVKTTASQCSVYTDKWTLVFDNAAGGGISVLTDSSSGQYRGTTGNQAHGTNSLYYFTINGTLSTTNGSWSIVDTSTFYTRISQSGTINSLDYTVDYTVHGSGKMFVKTAFHNRTAGTVSSTVYRHGIARKAATSTVHHGTSTASLAPYVMISAADADHFDPLMIIKDLWSTDSGAQNSATALISTNNELAGYEISSPSLDAAQKQIWEFMIDFSHKSWSDTTGIGQYTRDYRETDSLTFLAGTRALEKSWENHLEGHWALDEGTGSVVHDQSGNGRNGTLNNGTWSTGKYGNGLTLGSSSTVSMGDMANLDGRSVFTVMAWIKPSAVLSSSSHIFGKHDGSKGYRLTGDNGKLSLVLDNNTLTGNRTLETGKWYHVAATFSREYEQVYLYIDGRIDRIIEGLYLADYNSASAVIGGGFQGDIDDVRFYSEPVSENTLKAVYQRGYRSSEGFYQVRADNNSALHVEIDGGTITRRQPVFEIANYWGDAVPSAGAVVLDGVALAEGTDYYAKLDGNRLFLGLNKVLSWDEARLYVHRTSGEGSQAAGVTRKMKWGVDNLGGTDYLWVKNFEGNTFGTAEDKQFYLNWKMSNASQSKGGEIAFMSTSVSSASSALDTAANYNLIPDYSSTNDTWGQICFNMNGHWPKTTQSVSNTVSYEVAESSSVRLVLNIHERVVSSTESFRVKTRWTVYPTGQIFRYDSLYSFSSAPDAAYVGAFFSASAGVTQYQNNTEKRAGVIYSGSYPDFAYAWLGMKNSSGFQSAPFDSDTIIPVLSGYRTGFDFGDLSLPAAWNSTSIETALYLDIQHSSMSQNYIDSVSNSVQYIGTGGAALIMLDGALVTNSTGDLNGDGFNDKEGAYVVSATNNTAHFKLPARGDTARYYPAFRITNYTAAKKPQYVFVYRGKAAGDTLALLEGYQYNMYHNVANDELVFQIDSVFNDTVEIYLSSDVTLAVTLSKFQALPGDGCDTLKWRTESESENLGFHIYRRIKPAFLDSISKVNDTTESDPALSLLKERKVSSADSSWVRINRKIIPGAESGISHGPKDYEHVDRGVYNHLLYEYMLVAVDFTSVNDTVAFAEAMPLRRLPTVYRLWHNYPNPFRSKTTIRFELPVETRVQLNIYDLKGRLVKRVVKPDKAFKPGSHKVLWDGRDESGRMVAAGHYLYRFRTRDYMKTKRMVRF